eukprot:203906-Amphidinium_carterae.5
MSSFVSHSGGGLTSVVVPGSTGVFKKADSMSEMKTLWLRSCASVSSILSVIAAGVVAASSASSFVVKCTTPVSFVANTSFFEGV